MRIDNNFRRSARGNDEVGRLLGNKVSRRNLYNIVWCGGFFLCRGNDFAEF